MDWLRKKLVLNQMEIYDTALVLVEIFKNKQSDFFRFLPAKSKKSLF
jgi:hypothetical protein